MKNIPPLVTACTAVAAFALQGGPVQPDYVQFEPSGMQDMVNLLTGDFSYQVPLADIPSPYGNYPLSVSYHAGISPQQEATWVGLGWSLNPGSINRSVRGVPDDQFHGGTIGFIYQYSSMQMWNVDIDMSAGPFGLGMCYSSNGTVGLSAIIGANVANVGTVGFTLSTDGVVGLSATAGTDYVRLNTGISYSVRNGKKSASMGAQFYSSKPPAGEVGFGGSTASVGMTVSSNGLTTSASLGHLSVRKSRDGANVSVRGGPLTVSNSVTTKGKSRTDVSGVTAYVTDGTGSLSVGYSKITSQFWQRSATSDNVYGYMYQAGPSIDVGKKNALVMSPNADMGAHASGKGAAIPWKWSAKGRSLEVIGDRDMTPAYDVYSVASEGIAGSFRPFARETHQAFRLFSDYLTKDSIPGETYSFVMDGEIRNDSILQKEGEFVISGDSFETNDSASYDDYRHCVLGRDSCSVYGLYRTNYRNIGNRLVYNSGEDEFEERGGMRFLFMGDRGGYYESEPVGASENRERSKASDILLKRPVGGFDYPLYGSRKIEPVFGDGRQTGLLSGFVITIEDGTRYYFEQPVRSYLKVDYAINQPKGVPAFIDYDKTKNESFLKKMVDGIENVTKAFIDTYPGTIYLQEWWNSSVLEKVTGIAAVRAAWSTVEKAYDNINKLFSGHLEETCDPQNPFDEVIYSTALNLNPYATQWLLTEIRGADFVKLGDSIENNIGYNLKFHYTEPSVYKWRTPYARPGLPDIDLPNLRMMRDASTPVGCDTKKYQASFGVKENVYLESIESATHLVKFRLNERERVDGKGWDNSFSLFPMMVQTSIGYKMSDRGNGKVSLVPKYIYFNTPLPGPVERQLYKTPQIHVYQDDDKSFEANVGESVITGEKINIDKVVTVVENSYTETEGDESAFGLYRIEIAEDPGLAREAHYSSKSQADSVIVFGNGGHVKDVPYMNWANIVLPKDFEPSDRFENQMRYLERVSYYTRKDTVNPYREFVFGYDYSLQPKTLNSYCRVVVNANGDTLSGYPTPGDNVAIMESPDSAGLDVCDSARAKALYGKLTLRTITERGCQNGKCFSLPPFRFDYLSPSETPTRFAKADSWKESYLFRILVGYDSAGNAVSYKSNEGQYDNFTDIDATILSTTNAIDEYGLWSSRATIENHSVNQQLADYQGSAWSLNKITDPAGGVLEVEYERDEIGNGESYGDDMLTAGVLQFFNCAEKGYTAGGQDLCIVLLPLYWREHCLGPRAAFWDTAKVEGDTTDGYAYLEKMGLTGPNPPTVFFNVVSGIRTSVDCGILNCDRDRETSFVGSGEFRQLLDHKTDSTKKVMVLDVDYGEVLSGMHQAALKISRFKRWTVNPVEYGSYGSIWTRQALPRMKAGNLRVTRLTRHDMNVRAQTSYDYETGETAQLADSLYPSVLVNRFYKTLNSYTMPGMNLQPISRIVGFNDRDAGYIPAPQVMYPRVSVSNSWGNDSVSKNGRVEFAYITPESGIPADFIDGETKADMVPFIKLNLTLKKKYGDDLKQGHVFRISLYDKNGAEMDSSKSIMMDGDRMAEVYFYSASIRNAKTLKIRELKLTGNDWVEQNIDIEDENYTSFNEIMLNVSASLMCNSIPPDVDIAWKRYQKEGMFPILYKKVAYGKRPMTRLKMLQRVILGDGCAKPDDVTLTGDYDSTVTFYDLTGFVGLNYRTTFYRGKGDAEIPVKMDSVVYSTMVPDIADGIAHTESTSMTPGEIRKRIGTQVEHWVTTIQSQCKSEGWAVGPAAWSLCKENYLDVQSWDGGQLQRHYTHIRRSPFQLATVTKTGYDNFRDGNQSKLGTTRLENHAFDPATGMPTVSLAISKQEGSSEMRKLTRTRPFYSLEGIPLPDSMFIRNMLSQSYMNEIYSGTVDSGSPWDTLLTGDRRDYLRSFSISPFGFVDSLSPEPYRRPIVSWGTYTSKAEPADIYPDAQSHADIRSGRPPHADYSGSDIVSINGKYKVTETDDAFGRRLTTFYSKDGMFRAGLFYPSAKDVAGLVVPYQDTVLAEGTCGISGVFEVKDGSILSRRNLAVSYPSSTMATPLVMEYRMWTRRGGWETKREKVPFGNATRTLSVPRRGRLNYFRVYPESAQAKTFIYDRYGNMIQAVAEDNTSTYYEYDPLSHLVQTRNDDGAAFKAHHREWMNSGTGQGQQ